MISRSTFRAVWVLLAIGAANLSTTAPLSNDARAQEPGPADSANTASPLKKREPTQFVRVHRDEFGDPVALQTATAKYVLLDESGTEKLEVVLESVIHIADRSYFQAFNKRFQHYDVVLYELVTTPDQPVPDLSKPRKSPMTFVQQMAAKGLGLADQVAEIDYEASNLVHSDLSPEEMALAMQERGDDSFTMLADTMLHWIRQSNRAKEDDVDTEPEGLPIDLTELTKPGGTMHVRRLLADQFAKGANLDLALPPGQRASLIDDRNARAMEVFQRQVDAGHRKIALFWGAGHMDDFERRLILDYDLKPAGIIWRSAWDLREGAVERPPLEALLEKTLRNVLQDATELLPREEP